MRKLLLAAAAFFIPAVSHASFPVRTVLISTNTITRQLGTSRFQGLDVSTATISSGTVTNMAVSSITASDLTVARSTFTAPASFNGNKILNISSGTTASDATRYSQNKLLNVVFNTITTSSSTNQSTFVPSNLTGSITPSTISSRIKMTACFTATTTNIGNTCDFTFARNGSNLGSATGMVNYGGASAGTNSLAFPVCLTFTDSPASTSSISYTVYMREESGGITCGVGSGTVTQTITLEEINGL